MLFNFIIPFFILKFINKFRIFHSFMLNISLIHKSMCCKGGSQGLSLLSSPFIPFIYFLSGIAKIDYKRFWQNVALVLPLYVATTATLVSLFVDCHAYLTYAYMSLSAALLLPLTFFDRLSNNAKADLISLSILPIIPLISDRTSATSAPTTSTSACHCSTGLSVFRSG